jgi:hypothetical protein
MQHLYVGFGLHPARRSGAQACLVHHKHRDILWQNVSPHAAVEILAMGSIPIRGLGLKNGCFPDVAPLWDIAACIFPIFAVP